MEKCCSVLDTIHDIHLHYECAHWCCPYIFFLLYKSHSQGLVHVLSTSICKTKPLNELNSTFLTYFKPKVQFIFGLVDINQQTTETVDQYISRIRKLSINSTNARGLPDNHDEKLKACHKKHSHVAVPLNNEWLPDRICYSPNDGTDEHPIKPFKWNNIKTIVLWMPWLLCVMLQTNATINHGQEINPFRQNELPPGYTSKHPASQQQPLQEAQTGPHQSHRFCQNYICK